MGGLEHGSDYDVAIVGAGFAGLYALHELRDRRGLRVCVFEAGGDVGGTWYWNRYPGLRCDIESHYYAYTFSPELQQDWNWTERFAGQPEILAYLRHVTERFDLRKDIQFDTRVTKAEWRDGWHLTTNDCQQVSAQFLVAATGNSSIPKDNEFAGLDTFEGGVYYTARWPHQHPDFTGQRVGVVGTGSSGIQVIPKLAEQAEYLTVFQRTPNYATPNGNGPLDPELRALLKRNYPELRQRALDSFGGLPFEQVQPSALAAAPDERQRTYEDRWLQGGFRLFLDSYGDLLVDEQANETAAEFVRAKIRDRVLDPAVAERLTPRDHAYGTKRPPLETGYYETYNRHNVALIDLRESPIETFTPTGIRTTAGHIDLDSVVLATGFDAVTGAALRMGLRGRDGRALNDHWAQGPRTYLGLMVHGFPNLFLAGGPQSPTVIYSTILGLEKHVDWISGCIEHLRANGLAEIDPREDSERDWVDQTAAIAAQTLLPRTDSWWMGANVPGKPRVFMSYLGGGPHYFQACDKESAGGYEGFALR